MLNFFSFLYFLLRSLFAFKQMRRKLRET